jgi:hypothetical protein
LADQIRLWEDDERERTRCEHEGSSVLVQIVVGDGEMRSLIQGQIHLDLLECKKPSGSSHGLVGGGTTQRLIHLEHKEEIKEGSTVERASEEFETSKSLLGVDGQQACNPK